MLSIPKLRRNENVLTLQAGNVRKGTLDALSYFLLILIAVIGGKYGQ